MKELLIVAAAAAGGTYISQKWGASIEAKAVEMKIPAPFAHMAIVGGFSALTFFVVKQVI